ncbi:MAG: hypothetical protein A3F09_05290 [Chlamydiae bacterium RIFCSPHIGHO2_12_FULL_49_11]|nr:MAG: hypothetical protein A3F09_05290 [Chlamydiae bacterium RIFCSPHIGHO2_12_FULL_49_11]
MTVPTVVPNRVQMWEATMAFQCRTYGANSERGAVSSIGLNFVSGFGCVFTGTLKAGQSAAIALVRTVVALGSLTSFATAGREFGRVRDNLYVLVLSVYVIGLGVLRIVSLGLSGAFNYSKAKEARREEFFAKLHQDFSSATDGDMANVLKALSLREVRMVVSLTNPLDETLRAKITTILEQQHVAKESPAAASTSGKESAPEKAA